jgi:hypothetical protein
VAHEWWAEWLSSPTNTRFAEIEDKSIVERCQYKDDQFRVMKDQIVDLTTQISYLCGYKGNEFRNLFAKCQTHGCQHLAQAHANWWVSRFELKILKFYEDLQLKEFLNWVLAVEEVFEFNGVLNEQRVSLMVHTFWGRVAAWWQQLKQNRVRQGKLKINSWKKLLKNM